MTEKLMEYLTNPTKNKLIIETINKGRVTAKELAAVNKELPQATLYRYLKKMVEDGVLVVAEERKVRNVTEKIYAMGIDFEAYTNKMIAENSGEAYLGIFQQFTVGLLKEFSAYSKRDDIDIVNDGSGFRVTSICATFEELETLSKSIWELIAPYRDREPTSGRKNRSVAIIFTPPKDAGE